MFLERILFRVPFLSEPVASFDAFVRPRILPISPAFFRDSLLFGALFVGILFLNVVAERFWCRYLCPLGGLLGLLSKIALFRRKVLEDCTGCVLCTIVCPTGTINPDKHYASDSSECTMCLDCLETCPRSTHAFTPTFSKMDWNEYDPGRHQALLTIGATVAAMVLTGTGLLAKREPSYLLRPLGAREANPDVLSMTKCIRCSACMRACPTNAIQPSVFETGVEGFGAPLVIMRMGYCDYSCNAYGQVYPVQAIPPLPIEEKQKQVIGKAYINTSRYIAWSAHTPCIVCEEMCPPAPEGHPTGGAGGLGIRQYPHHSQDAACPAGRVHWMRDLRVQVPRKRRVGHPCVRPFDAGAVLISKKFAEITKYCVIN